MCFKIYPFNVFIRFTFPVFLYRNFTYHYLHRFFVCFCRPKTSNVDSYLKHSMFLFDPFLMEILSNQINDIEKKNYKQKNKLHHSIGNIIVLKNACDVPRNLQINVGFSTRKKGRFNPSTFYPPQQITSKTIEVEFGPSVTPRNANQCINLL